VSSIIGRIVHRGMVENAVRDITRTWLHTYLLSLEQDDDLEPGGIVRVHNWVRTTDPLQLKFHQLPAVAVVSGGFADQPRWTDSELGRVATLTWQIILTVYARGRGDQPDEALDNAGRLIAAATAALAAKGATHALISSVDLLDLDLGTQVHSSRERTLTDAQAVFAVRTPDALSLAEGPDVPVPDDDTPEIPDPPEAETVSITFNPLEPDDG
jgi:hypothetical protein